jgi:hypothetical protein
MIALSNEPGKQHVTKYFLRGPCEAKMEGQLEGDVLWRVRPEAL